MSLRKSFLLVALGFAAVQAVRAQSYQFTTLAGSLPPAGYQVFADGTGSAASFGFVYGLTTDAAGNLYATDAYAHSIRRITPDGTVTTIAGSGLYRGYGHADGPARSASFNEPRGLAFDAAGNLYISDGLNHLIRKLAPDGMVTTIAGSGSRGSADGVGSAASFSDPRGLAVDAAGNIFVADWGNHTIRKVTPSGIVTTVAGLAGETGSTDAIGRNARFSHPTGITVDPSGTLFVADSGNHTVRRISPPGEVTTVAGQPFLATEPVDAKGADARFGDLDGIALDASGNLYVTEPQNNIVRRISPTGNVITFAGVVHTPGSSDGAGSNGRLGGPSGITVDPSGNIWIYDGTLRRISPTGTVSTVAGSLENAAVDGVGVAARFGMVSGAAVDTAGNVFVVERSNSIIRKIAPDGTTTTVAGRNGESGSADGPALYARFSSPAAIAIDADDNLFIADYGNCTVRKMTPAGVVSTVAGRPTNVRDATVVDGPRALARFAEITSIAVGPTGNLYVGDSFRIRKVSPDGTVSTLAGGINSGDPVQPKDGVGPAARFGYYVGLAVDRDENVFVADTTYRLIRKITPQGVVTTVAGNYSPIPRQNALSVTVDGIGPRASFGTPSALAVDRAGNIFVTEPTAIRMMTPLGSSSNGIYSVRTIAGVPSVYSFYPVSRPQPFFNPAGIAIKASGQLVVADTGNQIVQLGTPVAATSRLVNLSARAQASAGGGTLIVGFHLSGPVSKPMLIRAVGPTLANFGVSSTLPNPSLSLKAADTTTLASNDDWNDDPALSTTAAAVGAFALPAGSKDAALLPTLASGGYTAHVGGGSGVTLVELYDAATSADSRLVNLSCRALVSPGGNGLIAGFVITGDTTKRVLIRGVGPTLATYGVGSVLARPHLALFSGNLVVAENSGWNNDPALASAYTQTGAFSLPADSKDAALIVNLPPGIYSAQLDGVGDTSGVALVELYELP